MGALADESLLCGGKVLSARLDGQISTNRQRLTVWHGTVCVYACVRACDSAAWLSDSMDNSNDLQGADMDVFEQQQQRDIDVCRKMHAIGWAMIDVVNSYGQALGARIECRVGVSSGQVRIWVISEGGNRENGY